MPKWMNSSLSSVRKNSIDLVTMVDRCTGCILGWEVVWDRSQEAILDRVPKAHWYFRDAFNIYEALWYRGGRYAVSDGKTDTYSVEADNAELRHCLARLARVSRCFFCCPAL